MNILVVEDEKSIREVETAYLKNAGYEVIDAEDGEEALELLETEKIDLVVLDINLPNVDGIEVCKKIRESSMIPIIMVTARIQEIDELIGLEIGADDYIKKPFSPNILVARVKAILKRIGEGNLSRSGLHLDPQKLEVLLDDKKISFTTTEFNILYTLALRPGRVFTRDQILDMAYKDTISPDVFDRTVDAHIKNIRKKLKAVNEKEYIITVIGRGYKFVEN